MRLVDIKCTQFCTSTCIITYFPKQWYVVFRHLWSGCIPDTIIGRTSRWQNWYKNQWKRSKKWKIVTFSPESTSNNEKKYSGNPLFCPNFINNKFQNMLRILTIVLFACMDAWTIQFSKDKKTLWKSEDPPIVFHLHSAELNNLF